jgi:hypothetical protein
VEIYGGKHEATIIVEAFLKLSTTTLAMAAFNSANILFVYHMMVTYIWKGLAAWMYRLRI